MVDGPFYVGLLTLRISKRFRQLQFQTHELLESASSDARSLGLLEFASPASGRLQLQKLHARKSELGSSPNNGGYRLQTKRDACSHDARPILQRSEIVVRLYSRSLEDSKSYPLASNQHPATSFL